MASTTTTNEIPIVIGEMGRPESIVMTHLQARFLLGFLVDPDEVDQMIRYIQHDLGDTDELIEIAPTPVPAPTAPPVLPPLNTGTVTERMEAARIYGEQMAAYKASQQPAPTAPTPKPEPKVAPTPAPDPTPSAPKVEAKPKATRNPVSSPTATCAVSSPSLTPNVASGTGVEKITSAAMERETLNERDLDDLRQRAQEIGVTGAIHKMKAETLRARIALAETALAEKPVAVAAPVAVQPVAVKPARKLVADFLNVLPDGRELYTAVYSDGSIENELSEATSSAAA